jgi:hypothetical protein
MAAISWHNHNRALDPGQPLQSFRGFIANLLGQHGFGESSAPVSAANQEVVRILAGIAGL